MEYSCEKNSIMTFTEIAVEKFLAQLTANYDPHETVDSAKKKKKKTRIICAKPKYFLANILLLFSLTNLNMFQGQDFRGSFSTIC